LADEVRCLQGISPAPEDDTENDLLIDPLHDRAIEKAPE
jgi:hypothetical protein